MLKGKVQTLERATQARRPKRRRAFDIITVRDGREHRQHVHDGDEPGDVLRLQIVNTERQTADMTADEMKAEIERLEVQAQARTKGRRRHAKT